MRTLAKFVFLVTASALVSGCPFGKANKNRGETESPEAKLIARGRAVYISNCTSCHNINPKLLGSLGPDVHGSSKELLVARLIHAKYPEGYTPKRPSQAMPAMPHLSNDIDALAAYLNIP